MNCIIFQTRRICKNDMYRSEHQITHRDQLEVRAPIVDLCCWVDIAIKLKSPPLTPGLYSLVSTLRRTSGGTATPWAKVLSPSPSTKVGWILLPIGLAGG